MSHEKPFQTPEPIPEENEVPMRIKESKGFRKQGSESAIWRVIAETPEGQERLVALKQVRKEEMVSLEAMEKSKAFYDFLKSFPDFAKFVPDTLYFVARETKQEKPHAYRLQKMNEGKQIDELSDEEIAKDPVVIRQLIEFIDASKEVFETAEKKNMPLPDYYGSSFVVNYLHNPRQSTNVVVTEKSDENGERVFFVDVGANMLQQVGFRNKIRPLTVRLQLHHLKNWRKRLEKDLNSLSEDA